MVRDLRNLKLPPGGREAKDALSEYVSARTVALLLARQSDEVYIGSATAVKLGEHYLLATAAHNITDLDRHSQIRVIPRENPGKLSIALSARSHPRPSEYSHDVAWFEVEPSVNMPERKNLEPIPKFESEDEEREFWATRDSTDYVDWSRAKPTRFPRLRSSGTPPN